VDVDVNESAVGEAEQELNRRSFLSRLALGGATLAVAGTGVLAYRAYDQGVYATGRGSAYEPWRDWRDATGVRATIAAAILAANAHNAQAWRFGLHDDHVDVFADPTRATGTIDPFERELHVSLGCAIENLVLAAEAEGRRAEVRVTRGVTQDALVARVDLIRAPVKASELYRAIPDRHTNRGAYEARHVPGDVLDEMSRLGGDDTVPAELRWLTTPADMSAFGSLMVRAAHAQIDDRQQSIDGFRWFRDGWDAIQRHRDGLTIDGQGLGDLQRAIGKLLPASSRSAGDDFFLDRTRDTHVATAAAYGIVTVPDPNDIVQQLAGGRLLQRLHLWATAHGVALHHMNQITERIDRDRQLNRLSPFAEPLASVLDVPAREALVSFRIGYPTITARKSPRRPVDAVLR
jgi:hypothetical protein